MQVEPTMNLSPLSFALLIAFTMGSSDPTHFTGDVSISCGSTGTSAAKNGKQWIGDEQPNLSSRLQVNGLSTTKAVISKLTSADPVPHKTSRISGSRFSYAFQVNPGQKIIRLHFNPAPYKGFKGLKDLFTVEAGPFILLSNFSASLTADALGVNTFAKEFCLNIQENRNLLIIFSPEDSLSRDTYAFINGIEIISLPASVSYFHGGDIGLHVVGQNYPVYFDNGTALEIVRRLNIKQDPSPSTRDLDSMFPKWATKKADEIQNNAWKTPVEVGFMYLVRLQFSGLGFRIAGTGDATFDVLINGMTAQTSADIVKARIGNNNLFYRDCVVMMRGPKKEGKRHLVISLKSYDELIDGYGILAGFEIVKLSNPENSLASPNPLPLPLDIPPRTIRNLLSILGHKNAILNLLITIICLVNIIAYELREVWEASSYKEENKPSVSSTQEENKPSARAERLCRHFALAEIKLATRNFDEELLIGKGGFGIVYKGLIGNEQKTVAVKRLKSNSGQGAREFLTEIETLCELRHTNLVSLIGYCNKGGEMILVYDYVAGGTLADHIYKRPIENNYYSSLTWKQRLNICIGAGQGLDFLHTEHGVIHRDVKASNILLDENFAAKVSDFGLAKPEGRTAQQTHVSTKVKGTMGYMDPHYVTTCKLTRKSDTYSFGVVLLEVLCGRRTVEKEVAEDERYLPWWFRDKISEGKVDQIVDSSLREEIAPESLKTFVEIAERCLHDDPKKRPTMSQVVLQLESALEQQDGKQHLVVNESMDIHVSDDTGSCNDKDVQSINPWQPSTFASTFACPCPIHFPKIQTNWKKFNCDLQFGRKLGGNFKRLIAQIKQTRQSSWLSFWKRAKPSSTKNNLLLQEAAEEIDTAEYLQFSFSTIRAATDDFSDRNKLGQGGFGTVYKGMLPDGIVIAVKRLSRNSFQGNLEFKNEALLVARLQHRNLVRLLGFVLQGSERLLVYEFVENASLDHWIFDPVKSSNLNWNVRYKIIEGIARGILYLHEDSRLRIIHRDLKASNILLDLRMNPKIADFGVAKLFWQDVTHGNTSQVVGTYGYMAPEYLMHGMFSIKSDVFSFGVLVLEIITGVKNGSSRIGESERNLSSIAWRKWREGRVPDIVDHCLMNSSRSAIDIQRCIHIGLLCVQRNPDDRPTMASVIHMLNSFSMDLPVPSEPAFYNPISFSNCSSDHEVPPHDDVSNTDLHQSPSLTTQLSVTRVL